MKTKKPANALYLVGVLAWLIPGGGHWMLGKRNRAIAIFAGIFSIFALGIFLGGTEVIDPKNPSNPQNINLWFCGQILAGLPTIVMSLFQNPSLVMGNGRGIDLGQLYTSVAGLLNLLCIIDALVPTVPEADDSAAKPGGAQNE